MKTTGHTTSCDLAEMISRTTLPMYTTQKPSQLSNMYTCTSIYEVQNICTYIRSWISYCVSYYPPHNYSHAPLAPCEWGLGWDYHKQHKLTHCAHCAHIHHFTCSAFSSLSNPYAWLASCDGATFPLQPPHQRISSSPPPQIEWLSWLVWSWAGPLHWVLCTTAGESEPHVHQAKWNGWKSWQTWQNRGNQTELSAARKKWNQVSNWVCQNSSCTMATVGCKESLKKTKTRNFEPATSIAAMYVCTGYHIAPNF